jgi:murein DD-endopeptidase MepM/ murein hydrolase activator NlpD
MAAPPRPRTACVVALSLILAVLVTPRALGAADPLAEAQARITEAQRAADDAAAAYGAAETEYYTLQAEIDRTERDVARLRDESARLLDVVRQRAIVAYIGRGSESLDGLLDDASDAIEIGRRAVLLDGANAHSQSALDLYRATTEDLDVRESELRGQLEGQEQALEMLRARQDEVQANLEEAQRARDELRVRLERERRASEFAARVRAAQAAARANRPPPAAVPGDPEPSDPPDDGGGDGGGDGGDGRGRIIGSGDWVCPVQGPVSFSDTWGSPRPNGRTHKGVDMFAALGTPLVAVEAGSVWYQGDPAGGNAAYVDAPDGTTYYYAHMDEYVGGARSVATGEVIGTVGNTGTSSAPPHLHFEIRLGGANGTKINPYPTVAAHC